MSSIFRIISMWFADMGMPAAVAPGLAGMDMPGMDPWLMPGIAGVAGAGAGAVV